MASQPILPEQEEQNRLCEECCADINAPTRLCNSCGISYCVHYSSKIDPSYCVYCHNDVVLHDSTITKDVTTKSYNGKKTFHRVMKARHLVFEGQDWMLAQRRITTLDESEISTAIEYHREILNRMVEERETRRIAKNHAQIRKGLVFKPKSFGDTNDPSVNLGADIQSATVTTTKVTKTKIVASAPDPTLALKALVDVLIAKGLTREQAVAQLTAMVGKK